MNEIENVLDEMTYRTTEPRGSIRVECWTKLDNEAEYPSGIHIDWEIGYAQICMRTNAKSYLGFHMIQMDN